MGARSEHTEGLPSRSGSPAEVLDGVAVTGAESVEARDRFAGRLTIELLEEKIGPAGVSAGDPQRCAR